MRDERDGEAKMKAGGIAHQRVARGQIGMHGEGRLRVRESRDDDPPNAFDGIERQNAFVALDQPSHHLGFARGAECRGAGILAALDRDQAVDDLAALDQ